ncbi:MAG: DUF4834 family protein [Alloprevotella sp.]
MHLLGCLGILIFGFLFMFIMLGIRVITEIVDSIIALFTGRKPQRSRRFGTPGGFGTQQNHTRNQTRNDSTRQNKRSTGGKFFGKDEGEYVDFEEIRD